MADIIEPVVNPGYFSSLVDAIKAANLIDTLKNIDSFIVSGPTDQAFAKLPAGTVETLLQNINKLQELMTYHIVSGKLMPIKTFESPTFKIDPFHNVKIDHPPQSQHPTLLMITVSSTSLLIPR